MMNEDNLEDKENVSEMNGIVNVNNDKNICKLENKFDCDKVEERCSDSDEISFGDDSNDEAIDENCNSVLDTNSENIQLDAAAIINGTADSLNGNDDVDMSVEEDLSMNSVGTGEEMKNTHETNEKLRDVVQEESADNEHSPKCEDLDMKEIESTYQTNEKMSSHKAYKIDERSGDDNSPKCEDSKMISVETTEEMENTHQTNEKLSTDKNSDNENSSKYEDLDENFVETGEEIKGTNNVQDETSDNENSPKSKDLEMNYFKTGGELENTQQTNKKLDGGEIHDIDGSSTNKNLPSCKGKEINYSENEIESMSEISKELSTNKLHEKRDECSSKENLPDCGEDSSTDETSDDKYDFLKFLGSRAIVHIDSCKKKVTSKIEIVKNEEETEKCAESIKECFSCKIYDADLIQCIHENCMKFYHAKCLSKLPSLKSEPGACPRHVCWTCYNIYPKNSLKIKGKTLKCQMCPNAFHNKQECLIPGSLLLSDSSVTCTDHFIPSQIRKYPAVMNLVFCIECGCNEDLVFCKCCPAAIHEKCYKTSKKMNKDNFVCDRCMKNELVHYGDIVWAKVYNFRWWPARIVMAKDLPPEVLSTKYYYGEFPVQFFGSGDYYWTQKERVYPFIYKPVEIEARDINHNAKKSIPDPTFEKAVELARKAKVEAKANITAENLVNSNKPPPYKHVKSNRPVGGVQIYTSHDTSDPNPCGCSSKDPDPCGYDSMCLNRSMCTECSPAICEAGDQCQNQKFQRTQNAKLKPFFTDKRGWGLKCLEDIKKGHFVIEYCGDLIDEEECQRRIKEKQEIGDTNFYFCTLDSNRIIDAGPKGNFSRFMNHSCDPNCVTQKWIVNGDARVGLFARKDIVAGSEVTFDYQMDFSHYEKLKCNCGTKRCSGLIGKKPQNGINHSSRQSTIEDADSDVDIMEIDEEAENEVEGLAKKLVSEAAQKKKEKQKNSKVSEKKSLKLKRNSQKSSLKNSSAPTPAKKQKIEKEVDSKQTDQSLKSESKSKKEKVLCFTCRTGGKLIECSLKKCRKSFHLRCINSKLVNDFKTNPQNWKCPCHFCKKCLAGSKFCCEECPNSFCKEHKPGSVQSGKFLCPKHSKE